MSLKKLLFVTAAAFSLSTITAQRNFDQYNHLGLVGGIGFFNINTDNFVTDQGNGYMASFTTRGAVYNNFDLIYGIGFMQSQVGILGSDLSGGTRNQNQQYINYTLQAAQINLLGSMNIVRDHLSLEAGPILNVNGKLKLDSDNFNDFTLKGYETLKAEEIENVSRVHFFLAGGLTAGIENFRLGAQYQYGVTNLFNRYNDNANLENATGDFDGHASTVMFLATFYF